MRCEDCREIVSARVDGEDRTGEWDRAREHLRGCAGCREFRAEAERLERLTRLRPVRPVPDLTPSIVAAVAPEHDSTRSIRIVLAFAALLQIGLAVPGLLLGDNAQLPVHTARHLGSFDVALAVGYLWAAWRPNRALAGVFPIAAALVACLIGTTVLDVIAGRAAPVGELQHATDLVGLAALWLLGPRTLPRVFGRSPAV
jgi:predicted anti-sigma-YlaC factor YlaD